MDAGESKIVLGVAGDPVLHSLSPVLFKKFFKISSIPGFYTRVAANDTNDIIELFDTAGFSGMNITAPFKEKIVPLMGSVDPSAKNIGAVNLVRRDSDGSFMGFNTDHIGVVSAIEAFGIEIGDKRSLVIGTGGAARAAVYGLKNSGAEVTVTGRDFEKCQRVGNSMGVHIFNDKLNKDTLKFFDIIVSTIPAGTGFFSESDIHAGTVLLTADYKKKENISKSNGKNDGIIRISGYEWLYYQALPSFYLFTGKRVMTNRDKLNIEEIKNINTQYNRIVITGFTGSGKSVTGKVVSKMLGMKHVDIDSEIEKKEKMGVEDIFQRRGENYFRRIESEIFKKFVNDQRVVISCGGGLFTAEENRRVVGNDTAVFWIYRDLDSSFKSVKNGGRPLVKKMSRDNFKEFFNKRIGGYLKVSDIMILNRGGVNETAFRIRDEYLRING